MKKLLSSAAFKSFYTTVQVRNRLILKPGGLQNFLGDFGIFNCEFGK